MSSEVDAVVAGAGGFVGGHPAKTLVEQGLEIRAVDANPFTQWHKFDPSRTVNQLVDMVEQVAGPTLTRNYQLDAPQGVRGRCSDNTEVRTRYGWQPDTRLLDGIERTYRWVFDEVTRSPIHQRQRAEINAA